MAFQKTKGRGVFVKPTGTPDLSGFRAVAQSYQDMARVATGIGLDMRKRQYNDLIRQAEIDGKTAGAVFDKQGNLVPLTNFDYGKAGDAFNETDKKGVLAAYKKAALTTYVSAASNDIIRQADVSLLNNPNDPNAIRGALDGYLEGARDDLDPEVYAALAPKAVHSFGVAENRALAQQQKEAKEYAINTNSERFRSLSTEKAILMANQGGGDMEMKDNLQARVDEINAEQQEIMETLRLNEVSEAGIAKFMQSDSTIVYSKMAQQHIERLHASGDIAGAYKAANDFIEKATLDTNVDQSLIKTLATQTISNLNAISKAESDAEKKFRANIYGELYRGIIIDNVNILDLMQDPDSDFYQLTEMQQGQLAQISGNAANARSGSIRAMKQQEYKDNLIQIQKPDLVSRQVHFESLSNITQMYMDDDITREEFLNALSDYDDNKGYYHKGDRADIGATLQMELGPMSSYARPAVHYLSEEYVKNLEGIGVIGNEPGATYSSRSVYINAVEAYNEKRKEFVNLHMTASKAERRVTAGLPLSSTEQAALVKVKGFDKVRVDGQFVDFDLFSDNENVQVASIDAVASYAVASNGQMHPMAEDLFTNALRSNETADLAFRVMGQAVSAIRKANPNVNDEIAVSSFLINSNLPEDVLLFIRSAQATSIELARESFVGGKTNKNRNINELVNTNGYGDDPDEFFDKTFSSSLEGRNFFDFFQPIISDEDDSMLKQMASDAGVSNIEGAVVTNPYLKQTIKNLFFNHMLQAPNARPETVMRDVVRRVGKRVGVEVNPENGRLEFVQNPILKQAQSTVPAVQFGAPGAVGRPVVQLSRDDINRDVVDRMLGSNVLLSQDLIENLQNIGTGLLQNKGYRKLVSASTLHYYPNEYFGGGKQTYKVFLKDGFGKMTPLINDYSYDFKQSRGYESFQKAASELETDRAKKIWSVWGLLDQSLVQNGFERIEDGRSDMSLLPLVNAYNSFAETLGIPRMSDEPLNADEIAEFNEMIQRVTTFGYK